MSGGCVDRGDRLNVVASCRVWNGMPFSNRQYARPVSSSCGSKRHTRSVCIGVVTVSFHLTVPCSLKSNIKRFGGSESPKQRTAFRRAEKKIEWRFSLKTSQTSTESDESLVLSWR